MNKISIIFIIQYLISGCLYSQSPELAFVSITWEHGLSHNIVYDIMQDSRGFIWFATRDGLNRYDGHTIKVYRHSPFDSSSISVNWTHEIYEDSHGKLWIATIYGGVNRFDPETERFISFKHDPDNPNSLTHNATFGICEDDSGNFWIGTWDGLNKLIIKNAEDFGNEEVKFIHYKHDPDNPNSLSDNRIWTLHLDTKGILWIGTDEGGLNRFDPKTETFIHYHHDPNNPNSISTNNYIRTIYEDPLKPGRIFWIATKNGLNKFDAKTGIFVRYQNDPHDPHSLSHNRVMSILRDKNKQLWVSTFQGLNKMILPKNEKFSPKFIRYQSQKFIYPLYEDNSDIFWFGGIGGGVRKVIAENKNFTRYVSSGVLSIYEDEAGILWLGTDNGLQILDQKNNSLVWYRHDPNNPNSLSYKEIYSIYKEPNAMNRTIWILCRGGGLDKMVFKNDNIFEPEQAEITHTLPDPSDSISLACKWGVTMLVDKTGTFWIGTNQGLYQFDKENRKVTKFKYDSHRHINDRIEIIYQSSTDNGNTLWVGTVNGLYHINLDNNAVAHYNHDPENFNSLSDYNVQAIATDANSDGKIIWIGTYSGGLNKFDLEQGTFKHYTEKHGLSNNTIYSILEDDNGNLWIGTPKGLTKFNPLSETFRTYDYWDGVLFSSYYPGACFKSPQSGEMFFCNFAFYPDSIKEEINTPPIVLTDFKVFNEPFKLEKSIFTIDELRLSYKQNFFSFEFAVLDYTIPSKNQYAYLLEGIDKDWVYSGNRHYVSYTNVPPGEYIFRVKGSNHDGIWNEQGTAVKIIIKPPFWQTAWFRVLIGLFILGIFALIFYIRVSMLKKERNTQQAFSRRLIEEVEKGRKRIARELHDGLGQNLLIIKNELHQAILSRIPPKEAIDDLNNISTRVSESIHEVREISTDLHPHQLDRLGLTEAIESVIEKFSETFSEIKFVSELAKIDNLLPKDLEIHIFRIIQEGLNNIVKHANCTRAIVQIKKTDKFVNIIVKDNGCGFDFKSYAIDRIGHQGFGLSGIAERVKILKGKLVIDSEPGRGTAIQIHLQIKP